MSAPLRSPACALTLALPFVAVNLLDGFTKPALASDPTLFWSYDFTKWVLLPAASLFAMRVWCGSGLGDFGLRAAKPGRELAILSGLTVLYTALSMSYFAFQMLAQRWLPSAASFELSELLPAGPARILVLAYLSATAACVEEFYYRGVLLETIAPARSGLVRAAAYTVVSSALFGASHFESGTSEVLAAALYGVVAALFALRVRNLWPLIVGHFATDLVALQ